MLDKFNRKINYLRISVTDRCNFRCVYCMPAEGVKPMHHSNILRYNEILEVVKFVASKGVNKIRITGGEPLVRKGIVDLVSMIAKVDGITDFGMTTNGVLLNKYAKELKDAGLHRVNISLDTLNPKKFRKITRIGTIDNVLKGIEMAQKADLTPIKINCVIKKSSSEKDAQMVTKFCNENGLTVRYIREMDLEKGKFWKVQGGEGGKCSICNRLRLTSDGKIKPCLFSDIEYSVRELGVEKAIMMAMENKPLNGTLNKKNYFSNIGG